MISKFEVFRFITPGGVGFVRYAIWFAGQFIGISTEDHRPNGNKIIMLADDWGISEEDGLGRGDASDEVKREWPDVLELEQMPPQIRWPFRDTPMMAPTKGYHFIVVAQEVVDSGRPITKDDSCYLSKAAFKAGVCNDYRTPERAKEARDRLHGHWPTDETPKYAVIDVRTGEVVK